MNCYKTVTWILICSGTLYHKTSDRVDIVSFLASNHLNLSHMFKNAPLYKARYSLLQAPGNPPRHHILNWDIMTLTSRDPGGSTMLVADEALTEIQFPREVAPPASYTTQSPEVTNLEGLVGKCDAVHCPASFAHNAFFFFSFCLF